MKKILNQIELLFISLWSSVDFVLWVSGLKRLTPPLLSAYTVPLGQCNPPSHMPEFLLFPS